MTAKELVGSLAAEAMDVVGDGSATALVIVWDGEKLTTFARSTEGLASEIDTLGGLELAHLQLRAKVLRRLTEEQTPE